MFGYKSLPVPSLIDQIIYLPFRSIIRCQFCLSFFQFRTFESLAFQLLFLRAPLESEVAMNKTTYILPADFEANLLCMNSLLTDSTLLREKKIPGDKLLILLL